MSFRTTETAAATNAWIASYDSDGRCIHEEKKSMATEQEKEKEKKDPAIIRKQCFKHHPQQMMHPPSFC